MADQSYFNHIRFYTPHHFVFYPVMLVFIIASAWFAWTDEKNTIVWLFITAVFITITMLSFMMRQHYALTLQNRIVLMELRYRYFVVTGQRLESLEEKLTEGQLFALRFAPDEELVALTQKAINENLSADKIKKSIKHWKADNRRV
ncbi:DUF6526 family protein [Flavobacterium cerinum]|uniref:Uncharacterized protein n=1 Tax=Flavobacterium cerinum TaxID=2502784 RepID=A0A3S3RK90_9FLAO|nr:DUF6526 family protein [Flavobacterium cerinum]RWX01035.1 hypothetical protein EPI11_08415 [Flavobacterium cerinum]